MGMKDGAKDGNEMDKVFEKGNADENPDNQFEEKAGKKRKMRSPIKTRWMVPLIKEHNAEQPNMYNKECSQLLNLYVHDDFLTKMILQIARPNAWFELFGDPVENAHYTRAILREAAKQGHNVLSISKTASEVMAMLDVKVVKEEVERVKTSDNILMSKQMKLDYIEDWKDANQQML